MKRYSQSLESFYGFYFQSDVVFFLQFFPFFSALNSSEAFVILLLRKFLSIVHNDFCLLQPLQSFEQNLSLPFLKFEWKKEKPTYFIRCCTHWRKHISLFEQSEKKAWIPFCRSCICWTKDWLGTTRTIQIIKPDFISFMLFRRRKLYCSLYFLTFFPHWMGIENHPTHFV